MHTYSFFLICHKDKGNKKGDLIQSPLFPSFIHTNKQLFPKYILPVHSPSDRNHHPTIRFTDFVR